MGAGATGTLISRRVEAVSFNDIIKLLRQIVPTPFEVVPLPRKSAITHRHFDVSRLFLRSPAFRFTSLEEGLRSYYRAIAA